MALTILTREGLLSTFFPRDVVLLGCQFSSPLGRHSDNSVPHPPLPLDFFPIQLVVPILTVTHRPHILSFSHDYYKHHEKCCCGASVTIGPGRQELFGP